MYSVKLKRHDDIVHINNENAAAIKSWTTNNSAEFSTSPWSGAFTKTFLRDSINAHEMDPTEDSTQKRYSLISKLIAEFVGDLIFIFIGSLSALNTTVLNGTAHAAFAHGLTIFVLVASLGHISGGHFNPAITWAVMISGKMNPLLVLPYWIAQFTGGFVGAILVWCVTQAKEYDTIFGGATVLPDGEFWYQGLIVEIILTLILTQTVLTTAVDTSSNFLAPLAIGLTITLDVFGAGSISGASMNPARSFGPCATAYFFSSRDDKDTALWNTHYIYWAGPFLGSTIAALLYRLFFTRSYNRIMH